jgi:hypothetical protein
MGLKAANNGILAAMSGQGAKNWMSMKSMRSLLLLVTWKHEQWTDDLDHETTTWRNKGNTDRLDSKDSISVNWKRFTEHQKQPKEELMKIQEPSRTNNDWTKQ